nr:prolow-density lipoprotein receptor-related protein 1-like isoform X2 [Ciona intestinalis]|eukprot:XP_026693170.1 prolow-density lipoprotein receptor-related protein 1-like isoform X2 [Ciona intestinalis]
MVIFSASRQNGTNVCAVNNGGCEELCFHVGNNVRRCACAHGVLTANNRSCQPHKQYIAYSESKLIQSINVDDLNDPNAPLPGIDNPDLMKSVIALAMDYKGHRMFYSDMTMRNIYSVNTTYNGRSISNPQLVARDVGPVEGLAYHKVEHALYWTSLVQRDIRRQLLNSTNIEIIVPEQDVNDRLRALVLYECARPNYIFWTNWNERNASVSRSTSGGRNIKSIISTKIKTPNALTIDIIVKQLYWADASLDKIERCDFDGGNRQVIISNGLDHIFSLAVLGKYLYWSDWGNRMILRANKWNGGALEIMRNRSYPHPLGVMAVYDDKCGRDPCDSASCKYRCVVLDDGSAACMCPDGVISDECGAHTVCTNDQFDCGEDQHLRCVAYIYTCDGTPHCSNGADETDIYCRTRSCRDGYWMCENDTCIDKRRVCDGLSDCDDGSDEDPDIQCPNSPSRLSRLPCSYGMFSCGDGKCIPLSWKCDSESDCDDGSDENCNHTCPLGHFQCSTSHKCIPLSYVCDADKDCFDGSDEANCSSKCREDFFSCVGTGHCIPDTWVCDGEVECPDGSDELSCDISCGADKFRCDNGNCISMAWKCDREFDCDDHSDEVGCSYGACKQSMLECKSDAECYMHEWKCDGDMDCSDGTDEMDCPPSPTSACPVDHIPCGNGSCINLSKACNNVSDCTDGADEKLCFVNECENKQSNRCQQLCINRDYSYKCGCRPGFQLSTDGYSCSEINECAHIVPPCSQICEKYPNTYECSCAPSYYRDPLNRRNCKAGSHTGEPYILFANEYFLRQLSLNGSNYSLRLAHLSHMTALDFDWSGQKLYWSDTTRSGSSIQRMNLNKTFHPSDFGPGSDQSGIETIHQSLQKVDGLAVDWIGRNIYWSERDKNTIEVSKLDGSFRKVLVRSGLEEPQAIALLPDKGYLYWSDWGSDPHIGKIGMDGTDRSVIIHNRILGQQTSHSWPGAALGWPNALTIDYAARKLFWADAKEGYIAHCDLDGANAAIVVQSPDNRDSRIFSISLFEDSIYWTDWSQTSIMTSYKFRSIHNTTNVHPIHKVVHIPMDLKVVHPLRQPMPASPHPCLINNGDCSDLCLLSPGGGKSCSCPENFILQKDGISCVQNCSFSEFVCKNHKCIPFWWKCDTVDDCGDYSDEPDHCRHFFCTPGMYQCANTTKYTNNSCISPSAICDGTPQCTDGSDELNCDHHVCLPTQFRCSHPPKCILRMFRCDGKKDCDQGEDEIGCAPVSCSSTEYECQPSPNNETSCIPSRWKCDGDVDCYHGDDETNCTVTTCMDSEMKCSNTGPCISKSWACDGENDCRDGSDELPSICGNKTCNSDHFMCGNGILCIPNSWVCDSDNDCGDNSDERNCTNTPCASGEISCTFTQQCVKKSAKCDGKYDCLDQSDELYCHVTCNKDQFRCEKPPLCIPLSYKCDGVPHCNNGTDEINCKGTASKCCGNATFTCMDGACIPHVWKCDGELDCPDGSDEGPVCSVFQCPPDRPYRCHTQDICLPLNKLCDGINNCGSHNDDETTSVCKAADTYAGHSANSTHCLLWRKHLGSRSGNPPNPVGEHGFVCSSGECTPYSTLCDGVENCEDGSDEIGCFSGACNSQTNPCGFVIGSTCKPLPPTAKGGRYDSYCSCEHGLQLKHGRFGLSCFDIDECSTFLPCSQSCRNVYKGFRCNCFLDGGNLTGCFVAWPPTHMRFPHY